ncbi:MAG: glycosyltransferase family 2 protein [Planctomycetia bacterium]|nr:glycosyltransferase family 2 protein [Planctomycetia bacterium]
MPSAIDLSIVVPTFNGSLTLEGLVDEILSVFGGEQIEIVLVNDGSVDDTESICRRIAQTFPATVKFVQLARNFGEHNAVLAGLSRVSGACVGILDDDGQNPPAELLRMWKRLRETGDDVVYGRYLHKQHSWWRNAGSWLNGLVATILGGKPRDLYLSSFKVMRRPLVQELLKYRGSRPYLDGLIWRSTRRISQLDVVHRRRQLGQSGYTPRKLIWLGLDMIFCFSNVGWRFVRRAGPPPFVIRDVQAGDTAGD